MERCGKMSRLQWQMQSFLYFLAKEFASFVHKLKPDVGVEICRWKVHATLKSSSQSRMALK